jgi:hypothetical protein
VYVHVDPNSKAGKVILVVGIPLFAAILAFQGVYFCRAVRSLYWPSVVGVVSKSARETVYTEHGRRAEAKIEYVYDVKGTRYRNGTIAFGMLRGKLTWGDADRRLAEFPVGRRVTVYYDPRRPRVACLRRGGLGWEDPLVVVVCVIGLVMGGRDLRKFLNRVALGPDERTRNRQQIRQQLASSGIARRGRGSGSAR